MSFNKDRVMQELQRFGGAMYTPVILFAFFGLTVALSIIFSNTGLFGSLAEKGTLWYDFWYVVQQGAWTVFNQMPILFAIAVPIGFAKKEQARCAMEGFVIYMVFNYFIAGILTLHGSYFGVDYSQNAGAGTGLAMIANIKTLDMGMLGAIFIACISAYLHNHFYDTEIPDWLGIFKGPAFVVAVGFLVMLPMALLFCYIWPPIQHGIEQFQFFLKTSGIFGVWDTPSRNAFSCRQACIISFTCPSFTVRLSATAASRLTGCSTSMISPPVLIPCGTCSPKAALPSTAVPKSSACPAQPWPCTIVLNRKNARKSQPCSFRLRLQPSSAALPNRLNLPSCSSLRSYTSSMPS